jgi:nucleotide-binding universal stress UspA family protein
MAQQNGGELTTITVLTRPGGPHLAGLPEGTKAKVRRHLEEMLQAAANFARSRGVHLTPIVREGHPAETVVNCAEQERAELVVLGSNSGTGSRPGLAGTADQISSHAACNVLIVK